MAHNYVLKVTAGPQYDLKTHDEVHVNTSKPVHISSDLIEADINVRIQNYRGFPEHAPSTSPYFSAPTHTADLYSIAFTWKPKKDFAGDQLVFGNDFDHPIRDRLPWGFDRAFNFVKGWIDPGLDGDVQADEPYLYGPLLSSINVLSVGGPDAEADDAGDAVGEGGEEALILEEGAMDEAGEKIRQELGIPDASAQRQKHFLDAEKRKAFVFRKDHTYACDFFNRYLDFNDFALRLPILTLPIIKYWDGQPLRYVLRDQASRTPLFVITFTLVPADSLPSTPAPTAGGSKAASLQDGEDGEDEDGVLVDRPGGKSMTTVPGGGQDEADGELD